MPLKLSSAIKFRLLYQDATPFGSAVTSRCDTTIRQHCAPILRYRQQHGLAQVIVHARELLQAATGPDGLAAFYDRPGILRQDWLYPPTEQVQPIGLELQRNVGEAIARLMLPTGLLPDLAAYLGDWELGAVPPRDPVAADLWNTLVDLEALTDTDDPPVEPPLGKATFVGHSTVSLGDGSTQVLFDPFLLPQSSAYPPDYQPLSLRQLGRPSAVVITHSHPDHYDLGTLLRLGADTPIYVPTVERESVLTIDMALRLRQLGFRQVHTLDWFEAVAIGSLRIRALPFYGEQPTVAERLHPEVRNQGNTYLVEMTDRRIALTADSGTDALGDIQQLAAEAVERFGPLDVLFGGYRGFGLYPIQYLFSSVSRYLTFVPEKSWKVRQKMMCDAEDLIDVAEIWDAKQVVPYSDGGAPWFWMHGLGPRLDGSTPHIMAIDPTPDYVQAVASQRSGSHNEGAVASPVSVCLLRPGESLTW